MKTPALEEKKESRPRGQGAVQFTYGGKITLFSFVLGNCFLHECLCRKIIKRGKSEFTRKVIMKPLEVKHLHSLSLKSTKK